MGRAEIIERLEKMEPVCEVCGGTGRVVTMRSWFPDDGYRRGRCGICQGTGSSSFRNTIYAREQRNLRDALRSQDEEER